MTRVGFILLLASATWCAVARGDPPSELGVTPNDGSPLEAPPPRAASSIPRTGPVNRAGSMQTGS